MARTVRLAVVLAVVAVVLVAGLGAGLWLSTEIGPGHGLVGGGGVSPTPLTILAAGTLGLPFGSVASYVANTTPGVSAPAAAQQYEGSLAVVAAAARTPSTYSIVGTADFRLIPASLEPTVTSWEAVFASSPEALVYDPSVAAFAGINTTNWPAKLLDAQLPLGLANASTDPNGYNEIFVLELEGLLDNGSLSALYDHYFSTPVGSLAVPNPSTTRVELESNVAALLASHSIASFLTYRSYAVANHLAFVDLDPRVSLGSTDPADLAFYANASTTILSGSSTQRVQGAPVLFAVTVPKASETASAGATFVQVLLSPAGAAILEGDGLTPVYPAWSDDPGGAPGGVQPFVVPLPAALSGLLS